MSTEQTLNKINMNDAVNFSNSVQLQATINKLVEPNLIGGGDNNGIQPLKILNNVESDQDSSNISNMEENLLGGKPAAKKSAGKKKSKKKIKRI